MTQIIENKIWINGPTANVWSDLGSYLTTRLIESEADTIVGAIFESESEADTITSSGLEFSKMAPTIVFEMCFASQHRRKSGAGCKTRLHTPKAVTYHEHYHKW